MITDSLLSLYKRDLDKTIAELEKYSSEEIIWETADGIANSAGNLVLHILGNLNLYIGANLGNSGYIRNRPAEFSDKNIPKHILIKQLNELKLEIENTLTKISKTELENLYPTEVLGYPMTTEYFIMHLLGHLNYHLGQINYHRRLLS
jgi:uncharacterized damage-inducible protein DinB